MTEQTPWMTNPILGKAKFGYRLKHDIDYMAESPYSWRSQVRLQILIEYTDYVAEPPDGTAGP